MRRLLGALTLLVPLLALAAGAEPEAGKSGAPDPMAEVGDKEQGHAYARKFCTDCHAIEKDENLLFGDVPSFQDVANSEGMSPRALGVWLRTSHPNMPDFIIPPDDLDNVIAYIMSLRTPPKP